MTSRVLSSTGAQDQESHRLQQANNSLQAQILRKVRQARIMQRIDIPSPQADVLFTVLHPLWCLLGSQEGELARLDKSIAALATPARPSHRSDAHPLFRYDSGGEPSPNQRSCAVFSAAQVIRYQGINLRRHCFTVQPSLAPAIISWTSAEP